MPDEVMPVAASAADAVFHHVMPAANAGITA